MYVRNFNLKDYPDVIVNTLSKLIDVLKMKMEKKGKQKQKCTSKNNCAYVRGRSNE